MSIESGKQNHYERLMEGCYWGGDLQYIQMLLQEHHYTDEELEAAIEMLRANVSSALEHNMAMGCIDYIQNYLKQRGENELQH